MIIREVVDALERFAPLPLQEEYDNSGLQIGLTETEVSGALLCLDVTESVIEEAVRTGCNLIVSHHPLIFHPLKSVTDSSETERCVMSAIRNGIAVYSSHTCLDNARGGVCFKMAEMLHLDDVTWLIRHTDDSGSGVTGCLPSAMDEDEFAYLLKETFHLSSLRCNGKLGRKIRKVALCGGSGSFLIPEAVSAGADAFVTGEIGYHRFFGYDGTILLAEMGHFESEQFTVNLLESVLHQELPGIRTVRTGTITNPIRYY